jgi:hypothetical protein
MKQREAVAAAVSTEVCLHVCEWATPSLLQDPWPVAGTLSSQVVTKVGSHFRVSLRQLGKHGLVVSMIDIILSSYSSVAWVRELYRSSDRRLSAKLMPTSADRGCHVVSVTDPYGRILGFLDWSCYFFFQVASQFYSLSWVDPVYSFHTEK